jgi:HSP20 family protein
MNITRHVAWGMPRDVQAFRQAFERFLGQEENDQSNVVTSQWAPQVDIKEEEKRFVIYADIPGVDPATIEVSMDKGILTIKGERSVESGEQPGQFTRQERLHGLFHRRFGLPDSADADGITATGRHGVLEVSIPKKPETTPRRINIETGH